MGRGLAMIRQAAQVALSGGAPRAVPSTGAEGSDGSGSVSWFGPLSDLHIGVAGALGPAGLLVGASAAVLWTGRRHRR